MGRPKGWETTGLEEVVCYPHRSQEEGAHLVMGGSRESTRAGPRHGVGTEGKRFYCGFVGEEQARQVSRLRTGWFE